VKFVGEVDDDQAIQHTLVKVTLILIVGHYSITTLSRKFQRCVHMTKGFFGCGFHLTTNRKLRV
jgi:hypothetical protein